jgi:predicted RNA-binding Zn-ribbon protein involved in translation (DUF1610 family)
MSFEDFDEIETACPKCGHDRIRRKDCDNLHCDDGFEDEYEDDAINFLPGESIIECSSCHGTGCHIWCPECGTDLTTEKIDYNED